MMAKAWLCGILLAVPIVGFVVAEGIQARFNSQLRSEARRQVPDVAPERLALLTVDTICTESNPDISDLCAAYGRLDVMSTGATVTAVAGILLVLLIAVAGGIARGNRNTLVWVFRPGLYVTAAILTMLISAHAALLMAAIYFGESALINRVHVGIVLAVGVGAVGGVVAVARSAFSVVKRAETLAIGKTISREVAPQLWGVIEASAKRLGALLPEKVVIGVDPTFFVTEADVITQSGRLSGRTLYCSMPLARILTVDEFTAIIGHELGHFRGADTKFSERFYPIYRGAGDALGGLQAAGGEGWGVVALLPAMAVFGYFLEAFAVAESRLSRERELVADQAGASVSSETVMAAALVKVHAYAGVWNDVQQAAAEALGKGRTLGNASKTFADAITQGATHEAISALSESRLSHPTDSHPPLAARLESLQVSLESVSDAALAVTPQASAATLIPDLEKWEEEISASYQALMARQLGLEVQAAELEEKISI
jgi:Zn-dependent protease with chaperone function